MAVRIFQFGIVFAIGFCFCSASGNAGATQLGSEIPLSLNLRNPDDVIIGRGQSATLRCEVNSSAPGLVVSWLYEGNPILLNDTRKQVLGDGSLFIQKVVGKRMEGVEGQYRCLAKNNVGSILSNSLKLTIAAIGREFLDQPKDIQTTEYQPVVIPCRLQSTPKAVIYWQRDSQPLPQSTRYVPLPTGDLLITRTLSSDAGSYRCIVTNSLLSKKSKTKQSKTGQLMVSSPSSTIESPKLLPLGLDPNFTVLVGHNITLYCPVTGWPTPIVQWLNNVSIVVGNSSILDLYNVKQDMGGVYSCTAVNSAGRTTMHFGIEVVHAPEFNVTPVSITFPAAKTIRLDCQAKGVPQPKIHWLKNGEVLHTVGRIKKQQTGLVLSHSFTSDAGIYQCVAVNTYGSTWVAAQLTPYFSENRPSPPQNVYCQAYDNNSICLTWSVPGNATIQAYSVYAFNGEKLHDFVTNYTYYLANGLEVDTNYTMYVRSYSTQASDQSDSITCKTGAISIRNTKVEYVSETAVKLLWSRLSNDAPCGTSEAFYKVQWKRSDQSAVTVEHTTSLSKIISGLRSSSTYEFRVQSLNKETDNTTWISFQLASDKSSSEATTTTSYYTNDSMTIESLIPQQLEAITLSPYSINLTWFDVGNHDNIFYSICYLEVKGTQSVTFKGDKSCEKGEHLKSEANFVEIKKLKANSLYEFKVRSQNYQGLSSPYSHTVEVKTPTDVPSSVQDLKYKVINTSSVCVRWRTPVQRNGEIKKYVVSYTPDQNWPLQLWNNIDVVAPQKSVKSCWPDTEDAITLLLHKLKPNIFYTVIVRAETEAGLGNPTVPITFATKESIAGNYYPDPENDTPSQATNLDIYYKQKLGIAIGVSVSFLCVLCCIGCALFKKRCTKRQAMAQARLVASSNYYPPPGSLTYPGTGLQLRHPETCIAESHEMQHLVSDQGVTQLPISTPQVDSKGRGDYRNGQLNGSAKFMNGHIANGHVHIIENPRYEHYQCNGTLNPKKVKRGKASSLSHKSKSSSLEHPRSNRTNGDVRKDSDYNSNCNSDILQQMYVHTKIRNHNETFDTSTRENSLNNITQVSYLEDSLYMLPVMHRRSSPALSPNG